MSVTVHQGDALEVLRTLPAETFACCVTSPPYWRKRNYGDDRQIGLEATPGEYVGRLVAVFGEVRRALRDDGALWLNLADSHVSGGNGGGGKLAMKRAAFRAAAGRTGWRPPPAGFKDKDLFLAGAAVAEALRAGGWFLRQTIIWAKPSAIEPPRLDRPATSHEYVFLLSKRNDSACRDPGEGWWHSSVWTIAPESYGEHQAVMPAELAERCIKAGSRPAVDSVLDPFGGAGTTGLVADRLGRHATLIELNPTYAEMARRRIERDAGMFAEVA